MAKSMKNTWEGFRFFKIDFFTVFYQGFRTQIL